MATTLEYFGILTPQILLLIFALVCPALDIWLKMKRGIAYWTVAGFAAVIALAVLWLIPETNGFVSFLDAQGWSSPAETPVFSVNAFSMVFLIVFALVGMLVAIASPAYIKEEKNHGEYYALILLAVTGMSFVALAADLIVIFVGLEIAGISSYALTGFQKSVKRSSEAALKYFIVGGFSSAITVFGIAMIYGAGGTTNLEQLGSVLAPGGVLDAAAVLGIGMLIIGIGFKIAAVPFHMWAPDVYEGAPTTVTALLAAGSKKMGVAAFLKLFLIALLAFKASWDVALGAIAILTMTVGNIVAVQQTSVKRMLAYSSIAQAGYILIALPVATDAAVAGGILHVITHSLMKSGAFFVIIALTVVGLGETLKDFNGLSKRSPWLAFSMAAFVLSLAGIPPLAGFYSKFVLFYSAVAESTVGQEWLIWLAVAGILNSALSLYYYAKIIKCMYVNPGETTERIRVPTGVKAAIAIALIGTVVIGLFPQPFYDAAVAAGQALFGIAP